MSEQEVEQTRVAATEETPKKITAKEETGVKNPGRVASGKKLQQWSKKNKEAKLKVMAEEVTEEPHGWGRVIGLSAILVVDAGGATYWWYFRGKKDVKPKPKEVPKPKPKKKVLRTY